MARMVSRVLWFICLLIVLPLVHPQSEQNEHREFQYNSIIDPETGRYNFAYDTGHDNDVAHSLHMQYQDADGIVRGRYGYTDPRGKLRMVEYEAGPNGFIARGDVGPDQFPHGQAPVSLSGKPQLASYSSNDFELDPAPVQMAGWDPETDPLNQPNQSSSSVAGEVENGSSEVDNNDYTTTVNVTSLNALHLYGPELGFYENQYPGLVSYNDPSQSNDPDSRITDENGSNNIQSDPAQENSTMNVYNIDVDPNEIRDRERAPRSSDDNNAVQSGSQPIRVPVYTRHYHPDSHDHDAEQRYYRARQTHDHDAEQRRYNSARQTHDHDAEQRRYNSARQTHDHDAEQRRYNSARQTHDHDAEQRRARVTHDHDAEQRSRWYHSNHYHRPHVYRYRQGHNHERNYDSSRHYYPRRIFYRDSHSMVPHEHGDNPVYRNYRDHQHSDVHMYARYRNNDYPATAKPSQLQYIPSDKYHDKEYYWTSS